MSRRCVICGKEGFRYVDEYRGYLCQYHYTKYIEGKVDKCIKKYRLLDGVRKLLIALSGGKDSAVLATIISKNYGRKVELTGLHIDLGIPEYSEKALQAVKELSHKTGLPVKIVKLSDYGFTIEDAYNAYMRKKIRRPPCSVCGTVKRYILNKIAFEQGFDAIATGHNMDDLLLFSSVDIVTGQTQELVKLYPRQDSSHPKLVPRIRPLCLLTNTETHSYAVIEKIPVTTTECPYKPSPSKLRSVLAAKLDEIEHEVPGFKRLYISSLWRNLFPSINVQKEEFKECIYCGMPSKESVCSFCRIRMSLTKI